MSYRTLEEAISRGRGRERSFRCPVHGDQHASASVNVAKGVWICYTCGAHGTTSEIIESSDYEFGQGLLDVLDTPEIRIYPETWLDLFHTPAHRCEYWLSRFSIQAVDHFRLGYDYTNGNPVYPMRDPQGQIIGIVARQLDKQPKYLYPRGVTKNALLFNYTPSQRDYVLLVEGAMDAVACWEAGFDAMALYGSRLSIAQITLLARTGVRRVGLVLDNDAAGRRAVDGHHSDGGQYVPGLDDLLSRAGFEVKRAPWLGVPYKDIAEVPTDRRHTLLEGLAL